MALNVNEAPRPPNIPPTSSPIHLAPVRDAQHQDSDPLGLDARDHAIIADPSAPQAAEFARQCAPRPARITEPRDARLERLGHAFRFGPAEFGKLLFGGRKKFNRDKMLSYNPVLCLSLPMRRSARSRIFPKVRRQCEDSRRPPNQIQRSGGNDGAPVSPTYSRAHA
jgi:hypothetical protein